MSDPNWNKGFYYDGPYPRLGMKHARLVTVLFQPYVHYFTSFIFIVHQGEAWCLEKAKQIKPTLQTCLVFACTARYMLCATELLGPSVHFSPEGFECQEFRFGSGHCFCTGCLLWSDSWKCT